jgi:membrane-bound lytic murein transglycosylase B
MKINKKILKNIILLSLIVGFLTLNISSPYNANADDSLDDTKDDIKSTEKKLEKETQVLNIANSNYVRVSSQVKTTASLLTETANEIVRKEVEIKNLNDRVALYKKMLSAYLQEVYFGNQDQIIKLAVASENFNAVFGNEDQMLNVKEKILRVLDEIDISQNKLEVTTDELADEKEKHEKLLQQKKAEQGEIIGDIQESKATIADLQKKLAELQSDLSKVTGQSYDAKDISEAVKFASNNTRVPEGVLYGFLGAETHFNANTGQCTYDKVESDALKNYNKLVKVNKNYQASIDKLDERKDIFNDIVSNLGYNSKKKVSCTPYCNLKISGKTGWCDNNNDGKRDSYVGQGGAMGVAQFMSDVWKYSYETKIRAKTGHKTPDPWNITDGVMAMALKLDAAGATSDKASTIKNASISYLGTFNTSYYNDIIYWSKNYKTLFP